MGKTQLPPGFRFHPTDVELVRYYLKRKVLGKKLLVDAIAEVDIYKFEPPDLPDKSYIRGGDLKWHFFCPKEKKYATGVRANRSTECGYWKTTGRERPVLCNDEVVGKIKTLVYHFGKSPRGERTDWVMHEYRLEDKVLSQRNVPQDTYVVCVVFKKDGPGPRNGAQYGAPFKEEDWSDEEEEHTDVLVPNNPTNLHASTNQETNLVVNPLHDRLKDSIGGMFSESCVSDVLPAATTTTTSELPNPSDAAKTPLSGTTLVDSSITAFLPETHQTPVNSDKDIDSMLEMFSDDIEWLPFSGHNNFEVSHDTGVSAPVCLEGDIFNELPELSNRQTYIPRTPSYDLLENSELYIELRDLTAPLTGNLNGSIGDLTDPITPQNGNLNNWGSSYLNHQEHVLDHTVTPQNFNDWRSSDLNHQDHVGDFTASSSYLNHQGPFVFSAGNDDPYGFSASMRGGSEPDM